MPLPNAKYLVQTNWLGIEQGRQCQPVFINGGGTMKATIFAVVLLTIGGLALPICAQQQDLQEVMNAANALGARESELLGKKDAAGIASLFTSDGLLVMLARNSRLSPGVTQYRNTIKASLTLAHPASP